MFFIPPLESWCFELTKTSSLLDDQMGFDLGNGMKMTFCCFIYQLQNILHIKSSNISFLLVHFMDTLCLRDERAICYQFGLTVKR